MSFLPSRPVVLASWLNLTLIKNLGISWSLFSSHTLTGQVLLSCFVTTALILFAKYTFQNYKQKQNIFFEMLVLAGGCANLRDRILFGGVIDFIEVHYHGWYWPVFNFADTFIVLGITGILISVVRQR